MLVLGIETSCDETAVALYEADRGLLAHALHTQAALHQAYGGVVPELASRDHVRKLLPLIAEVLAESGSTKQDINAVAYTAGPGLVGALMVGALFGRSFAWALNIPALAIHHLEGHLLAAMLEQPAPEFPFVCLLVSGGHTLLMRVDGLGQYTLLGESLDDAAGEAFDKTAKLMGLPYPGGAVLAALAEKGDPQRYQFPRPMLNQPNLNFSFSGLKTHALTTWLKSEQTQQTKADIAYAFQAAVIETLAVKSLRALRQSNLKNLVVAGGVGANTFLRELLSKELAEIGGKAFFPRVEFCTDNGAMIAYAGFLRLQAGQTSDLAIKVHPRWPLTDLI